MVPQDQAAFSGDYLFDGHIIAVVDGRAGLDLSMVESGMEPFKAMERRS